MVSEIRQPMQAKLHVKVVSKAPAQQKAAAPAEYSARERLELLFDPSTFIELDAKVHHRARAFGMDSKVLPGDGVVGGFGKIHGRVVYAYSQDRTQMGGTLGEAHAQKICKLMDLAERTGCPMIGINDSGGARIQEGVEALAGFGEIFKRNVNASGVVPQISLLMGPCAGGAVYSPALTDFVIMVEKSSYMFVTGPKVVRAVTSEDVNPENLGGARVHAEKSGVAHFSCLGEAQALQTARDILSYLPQNNCETSAKETYQAPSGDVAALVPESGQRPYEAAQVIRAVVDENSFLEVQAAFAGNVCIGLARLQGMAVGIVANNPQEMAGVLDINASRKAARFVRFCNAFGLPIVTLVDVPGFLPGSAQEHAGIIDHGAKLAYAYCEAVVPKVTVILRKAYGGAYIVMGSKHVGGDINFAWPKAEIAVMGAAGAVEILYAKVMAGHPEPGMFAQEMAADYNKRFASPQKACERGFVDAVITPGQTRSRLIEALEALASKRATRPPRRNGNIPL